jgi:hypothetical protein
MHELHSADHGGNKNYNQKSVPYFWRGFKSPCGSSAPRLAAGHTLAGHGHAPRELLGGAREECPVVDGPDHIIPIRDGNPSCGIKTF